MKKQTQHDQIIARAKAVIQTESDALLQLLPRIDEVFYQACECILACEGRAVVIGIGKSGHIANKIAATLASTGTPAFFVHPGEASHGDLGMITPKDVVLALSYSGTTGEILTILPVIKRLNVPLISLTGNAQSPLAKQSQIHLDVSVATEACPLGLAPTSSTTSTLVMGDALAMALLEARGFTVEDFAVSHPGGNLGRRLLLRVSDLMHQGAVIPVVHEKTLLSDALLEMTQKCLGMTTVVDHTSQIVGIFTDGDLRRTLESGHDFKTTCVSEVMTKQYKSILPNMLAFEALQLMESHRITALPIVDESKQVCGIIHLHDLLRAGVLP